MAAGFLGKRERRGDKMKALKVLSVVCLFLLFLCGTAVAESSIWEVEGNPTCEDLGLGLFAFKIEPPISATYDLDTASNTVSVTIDGVYVDWSATIGIDAVIVKGGPSANVYVYDLEATSDAAIHAPINPYNGQPQALSHLYFCFDYEVQVTTAAAPLFVRDYEWSISKSASAADLILSPSEIFTLPYNVVVSAAGFVDSDWSIAGSVGIHNPAPFPATIVGVEDDLSNGTLIPVDCGVTFPYDLPANGTLSCTLNVILPNGSFVGKNLIEVATTGPVGPGSASTQIDFISASGDVKDACADASDSLAGGLGAVCAANNIPTTFSYSLNIGPYDQCGQYQVINTATITEIDSGATQSASWPVNVTVPCQGCTLSQGYWKAHSEYGPASYDDTWALLPNGADTKFFLSAKTYHDVLWTPVRGNAYFSLASAYIAAKFNGLNGASLSVVQAAYDQSTALLSTYTPAQIAALKGKPGTDLRSKFISLSQVLNAFNMGLSGPGHCSE
jgi:hypothetical protein